MSYMERLNTLLNNFRARVSQAAVVVPCALSAIALKYLPPLGSKSRRSVNSKRLVLDGKGLSDGWCSKKKRVSSWCLLLQPDVRADRDDHPLS